MTAQDDNAIKNFFLLMIVITIIFIALITYFGVKIQREEICDVKHVNSYEKATLDNTSQKLKGANHYYLQLIELNNSRTINYEFCTNIIVNSTNGVELQVVTTKQNDEELKKIGTIYAYEGKKEYCTNLKPKDITTSQYIGLKCVNCDEDNTVNVQEQITGPLKDQIIYDGTLTISKSETLAYHLILENNCVKTFKFFLIMYLLIVGTLGGLALMLYGTKKLEEQLFNDW